MNCRRRWVGNEKVKNKAEVSLVQDKVTLAQNFEDEEAGFFYILKA